MLHLAPLVGEIPPTIGDDGVADRGLLDEAVTQILEHDLHRVAGLTEDDGADPCGGQIGSQAHGAVEVAGPDAQLGVHDRRVVDEDPPATAGRRRAIDEADLARRDADQPRGVLGRVVDGRRGADEGRAGAVEGCDPPEPTEDVSHVGAKDASIGVQLVDHHVAEILEAPGPAGMLGQNSGVEHVGIGQHQLGALPGRPPGIPGGVAIVDGGADVEPGCADEATDALLLVSGPGLGRVEVDGCRRGIPGDGVQHGQVEAEALATGRRGGDDDVSTGPRLVDGVPLMTIELPEPTGLERLGEGRLEVIGEGGMDGPFWRQNTIGGEATPHRSLLEPLAHDVVDPCAYVPRRCGHDVQVGHTKQMSRMGQADVQLAARRWRAAPGTTGAPSCRRR